MMNEDPKAHSDASAPDTAVLVEGTDFDRHEPKSGAIAIGIPLFSYNILWRSPMKPKQSPLQKQILPPKPSPLFELLSLLARDPDALAAFKNDPKGEIVKYRLTRLQIKWLLSAIDGNAQDFFKVLGDECISKFGPFGPGTGPLFV